MSDGKPAGEERSQEQVRHPANEPESPARNTADLPAADTPAEDGLDLSLDRINTEGVLKEGFAGQEM